jgi:hypothetical protein
MKRNLVFSIVSVAVLSLILSVQSFARAIATDVSFTGKVTCSQCVDLTQRKGFTPWSWAMYRLSQGDSIVFITSDRIYKLQGDRAQLSKYIEDKATITGHLDVNTIQVMTIAHPVKAAK